ncbi:uncharacterized protein LOC128913275 isoform X2 [Rissa tridactyla]|uniref:uncharacterized protein LOC128913275 isoform X2 n=1 Tax=Rissa tridactyla TaxID=75485 RepID=UPI0023BA78D5|nr:uncharacterized protein LOC128913275 isoform X2 [Rissa tridactyla]
MNYSAPVRKSTQPKTLRHCHSPASDTVSLCTLKPRSAAPLLSPAELWLIQKSWSSSVCSIPAVLQAQRAPGAGGRTGALALRCHSSLAGQRGIPLDSTHFFANAALLMHSPNSSQSATQESRKWPERPIAQGWPLGASQAQERTSRRAKRCWHGGSGLARGAERVRAHPLGDGLEGKIPAGASPAAPGRLDTILRTLEKRRETSASESPGAFMVLSGHTRGSKSEERAPRLRVVPDAACLRRFPQPLPPLLPWGAFPQLEGEVAPLPAPRLPSPAVTEGAQGSWDKPSPALLQGERRSPRLREDTWLYPCWAEEQRGEQETPPRI